MPHRRTLPQRRRSETFDLRHGENRTLYRVTLGFFEAGELGEVFVTGAKAGSDLEATARDGAILLSLALQYGVPLDVICGAITRDSSGAPSTIIGAVIDNIGNRKEPA